METVGFRQSFVLPWYVEEERKLSRSSSDCFSVEAAEMSMWEVAKVRHGGWDRAEDGVRVL